MQQLSGHTSHMLLWNHHYIRGSWPCVLKHICHKKSWHVYNTAIQCIYSIMMQIWWVWRIHKGRKLIGHFVRTTLSVQMGFSWVLMLQFQIGHDFMDKWTLVCRLASASITFITTISTRHQAWTLISSWLLKEHNQGATLSDTIAY